ncbi:DUF616 domain-containing protein [Tamlana sp. s12]|uniref:glycosyltransferase domain-containing protein n=1 Tax=Tamlana sp. s12 TaxID=1630406 RepID=UPI000801E41C|nr:glycosyltransferase domain-containing protein [Tamlana sp. s12]OBQ55401.1 hypothetical protein VQ01_07980 [Tamlana sp. s12]QQY80916.1 DUF616 domain-containing protein [Tamlana sp. s12]
MKIAIYTAIFGEKDVFREPNNFETTENVDCFLITDNPDLKTKKYRIILKEQKFADVTKNARFYKIFGIEGFNQYDYVIWHDGSLQMNLDNLNELILCSKKFTLTTFKHPIRNNFYDEGIACIKLNKDNSLKIFAQIVMYNFIRIPRDIGMFETSILVKNNNKPSPLFYKLWWSQINRFSRRDQLGIVYAIWKTNLKIGLLDGYRDENIYSKFTPHEYKYYIAPVTLLEKINRNRVRLLCVKIINRLKK